MRRNVPDHGNRNVSASIKKAKMFLSRRKNVPKKFLPLQANSSRIERWQIISFCSGKIALLWKVVRASKKVRFVSFFVDAFFLSFVVDAVGLRSSTMFSSSKVFCSEKFICRIEMSNGLCVAFSGNILSSLTLQTSLILSSKKKKNNQTWFLIEICVVVKSSDLLRSFLRRPFDAKTITNKNNFVFSFSIFHYRKREKKNLHSL